MFGYRIELRKTRPRHARPIVGSKRAMEILHGLKCCTVGTGNAIRCAFVEKQCCGGERILWTALEADHKIGIPSWVGPYSSSGVCIGMTTTKVCGSLKASCESLIPCISAMSEQHLVDIAIVRLGVNDVPSFCISCKSSLHPRTNVHNAKLL